MNLCIACLTRGYDNLKDYSMLLKRNKHIENHYTLKVDSLIFHEGNISKEHQKYIQDQTTVCLKFINVKNGLAFRKEKEKIKIENGKRFGYGYRHMCSFWFVDFWNFVKDYDYILRIDEDCYIDFDIKKLFCSFKDYLFIAGRWHFDENYVVVGLNDFTTNFIGNQKIRGESSGPYTNVFALNLKYIRKEVKIMEYIKNVDESNNIYKHRWGDLPLWGKVIDYITGRKKFKLLDIRYYHESHWKQVN